ncbi:MAG: DUF4105 domain-containing protein [Elusimicrobiota bacterium]
MTDRRPLAMSCAGAVLAAVAAFVVHLLPPPSMARDWARDQVLLPKIAINGGVVSILNIRRARYRSTADYDVSYYGRSFDLARIRRVWYMIEKFPAWSGMAHTLFSFEFAGPDGKPEFVAVSVEIRREKGEKYSVLKGLLRRFELMYVIADEEDVIRLRTTHRRHDVYLYPGAASPEKVRALFLDMMRRAQQLRREPEFYNSITNTCTTNLVDHVRKIAPGRLPRSLKVVMPGYSDRLAYDQGLIDNARPFAEMRAAHLISPRAREFKAGDFSGWIRRGISND